MSTALGPSITPAPLSHLNKRHFFECGDLTLSWEQEWYTAPFFLSSRSSYDRAASRGIAQPPLDIYQTVSACQRELGITVESTTTNGDGVAIWTTETRVSTTRSELVTATPTSSTSRLSSSATTSKSIDSSTSIQSTSTSPSTSSSISISSTSMSTSASSSMTTTDPSAFPSPLALASINTCAGDWDWQHGHFYVVACLRFILLGHGLYLKSTSISLISDLRPC
jgi:hypothetical protein